MEAIEENRVNDQVMGPQALQAASRIRAASGSMDFGALPRNGACDALLQPGCSAQLLERLPLIFRSDPPVDCGRTNGQTAGLSCAYRENYGTQVFSVGAVVDVLRLATSFWDPSPHANVQHLIVPEGSRLRIVGDTHGQLEDVLWMFFKYGAPSPGNQYLFNGDIVDRGGHALEIFLLLLCLKRDKPESVHISRGNHEDVQTILHFGFRAELESKFGAYYGAAYGACSEVLFPLLPLVAVVSDPAQTRRVCVVHGGVPVDIQGQKGPITLQGDLMRINRARSSVQLEEATDFDSQVLFNLLWADPVDGAEHKELGHSGRGNKFVEQETIDFCQANQLSFLVRSHEVPKNLRGVVSDHNQLCYTVFSASNYCGATGNRGGILCCGGEPFGVQMFEHWAPPWPRLAELFASHFRSDVVTRAGAAAEWEAQFGIALSGDGHSESAGSRAAASSQPPQASVVEAQEQFEQFILERIVECKCKLFDAFSRADPKSTSLLPQAQWAEILSAELSKACGPNLVNPRLLADLAAKWKIQESVNYVHFLDRFKIQTIGDRSKMRRTTSEVLKQVESLRDNLLDFSAADLDWALDPNGDKVVVRQEFTDFLPKFGIGVPPWQAAAVYENIAAEMGQNPLNLDNIILCIALMARDPPPVNEWGAVAEMLGTEIIKMRLSYAGMFRKWDADRDGFLSLEELEEGLHELVSMQNITHVQVSALMSYIDSCGVTNGRVSMFEFVGAVAPRGLALQLQKSMLKEVLKRVWMVRPMLQSLLSKMDPHQSGKVSPQEFQQGILEINKQIAALGRTPLSEFQVGSIVEIAANGKREIEYNRFIKTLHIVDMENLADCSI